jgi:hypothetical protein
MAIMDANYDQEMMRLWGIISDLSEQLNQHRATASALRNQAEGIKVSLRRRLNLSAVEVLMPDICASQSHAIHTQTGFVLRRCVFVTSVLFQAVLIVRV